MTRAPLRILFVLDPDAAERNRAEDALTGIQTHLRGSKVVEVVPCRAAQTDELRRVLGEVKPEIVHFGGHAKKLDALVGLFAEPGSTVRVIVLDACYAPDLAEKLSRHVDCVLGMSDELSAAAAIQFATTFYEAVGQGKPVEGAVRLAGKALPVAELVADRMLMLHERPGTRADKTTLAPSRSPWLLAVVAAALPVGFAIAAFVATRSGAPVAPLVVTTSTASARAAPTAPPTAASSSATTGSALCRGDGTCSLTTAGAPFDGSCRNACFFVDGRSVACGIQNDPTGASKAECTVQGDSRPRGTFTWSKCAQ